MRPLESSLFAAQKYFFWEKPLVPSLSAFEVTLSEFAGGKYLPLPASKGPAFPFLLTLDGYPTSPADFAQGQRFSPVTQESAERKIFLIRD
jgi:hypothetical protein